MRFFHEKYRLIFLLLVILASGFLATSLTSYYASRAVLHNNIVNQQLPLSSDNIYAEFHQDFSYAVDVAAQMAEDTFLQEWATAGEQDASKIVRYLAAIKKRLGTNTAFFISDATHNYYHAEGLLEVIKETEPAHQWFFKFKANTAPYVININADKAHANALTVFINFKLYDENKHFLGVTGVGMSINKLNQLVSHYQKKYNRRVYFVDAQGNIMLAQQKPVNNIREMAGISQIADQILNTKQEARQLSYVSTNQTTVQISSRYISELKWYMLVEDNESEVIKPLHKILMSNLAIGFLAVCLVGTIMLLAINKYQASLEKMATEDQLSGLSNRAMGEILLEKSIAQGWRYPVSVILFDIDHFKDINDQFGHHVGDGVIATIGGLLKTTCRQSDVVARWGGEEFLIVMYDCDVTQATKLCEKIAQKFIDQIFLGLPAKHKVTASFGVTSLHPGESRHELLVRADKAMYEAKAQGRNRTVVNA